MPLLYISNVHYAEIPVKDPQAAALRLFDSHPLIMIPTSFIVACPSPSMSDLGLARFAVSFIKSDLRMPKSSRLTKLSELRSEGKYSGAAPMYSYAPMSGAAPWGTGFPV